MGCCKNMCLVTATFGFLLVAGVLLGAGDLDAAACARGEGDAAWAAYKRAPRAKSTAVSCTSSYVTMRDGVRLAVDACLPSDLSQGEKVHTVVHTTRYFRSLQVSGPFGLWPTRVRVHYSEVVHYLVTHGCVVAAWACIGRSSRV